MGKIKGIIGLFLVFILLQLVFAQIDSVQDKVDNIDQNLDGVRDITNDPKGATSNYLKQEWNQILEKTAFGRIILAISNFLDSFSPVFRFILGVDYSLSWAFIFSLIMWLTLFLFIAPVLQGFLNSKPLAFLASFIFTSIIGISGVIRIAISFLGSFITDTRILYFSLAMTVIIAFIIVRLGGGLKQIVQREKENSAKEDMEHARKIIKIDAETSQKKLESYKDKK